MATKSRLGKGLGALFPDLPGEPQSVVKNAEEQNDDSSRGIEKPVTDSQSQSTAVAASNHVDAGSGSDGNAVSSAATSAATPNHRASDGDTKPVSVTLANSIETMKTSEIALAGENASTDKKTVRSGTAGKSKNKRAAMPGIGDIVHPSDLFFGDTVASAQQVAAGAHTLTDTNTGRTDAKTSDKRKATDVSRETKAEEQTELKPVQGGYLAELKITDIGPNAHQPRTIFDEDELNELAASITEVGVLQPIVVRKRPSTDVQPEHTDAQSASADTTYELIMGERRWRASQLAGLTTIPAIVKTTADDDMLRDALLENLHRVALNPLEEAAAYQQMISEFGLTQAELSKSVSKSRPQIANTLRLLNLPASVQKKVAAGILSAGHARALLGLTDESEMDKLATRIIAEGLSVRSTEEIVAMKIAQGEQPKKARVNKSNPWANSPIQRNLENRFDTKVSIKGSEKHGRIEIVFSSPEDMDRILSLLMASQSQNDTDEQGEWK